MSPDQTEAIYNSLIVFAVGLLTWLGTRLGKKSKEKESKNDEVMEIAGAVINGADARMIADSFAKASANMAALQLELVENRKALDRNSDVCEDVRDGMRSVGDKIERMKDELIRSSARDHTIPPGRL